MEDMFVEAAGGDMATMGAPFVMNPEREGEDESLLEDLLELPSGVIWTESECVKPGAMFSYASCNEMELHGSASCSTTFDLEVAPQYADQWRSSRCLVVPGRWRLSEPRTYTAEARVAQYEVHSCSTREEDPSRVEDVASVVQCQPFVSVEDDVVGSDAGYAKLKSHKSHDCHRMREHAAAILFLRQCTEARSEANSVQFRIEIFPHALPNPLKIRAPTHRTLPPVCRPGWGFNPSFSSLAFN